MYYHAMVDVFLNTHLADGCSAERAEFIKELNREVLSFEEKILN